MAKVTEAKCSYGYCVIPEIDGKKAFQLKETEVTIYEYRDYLLEKEFRRMPASRYPIADPIDRFNLAGNTKARIDHKADYPYKASINYPVVGISRQDMVSYCRDVGGDLPTDRQMALASAGDTVDPSDQYGRLAVWQGESWQDGTGGTFPVRSGRVNQYGLYNLTTGSYELTLDGAQCGADVQHFNIRRLGPPVGLDIVKGGVQVFNVSYGAFNYPQDWNISMCRVVDASGSADYIAGFRCAKPMSK